jgi:hypothetical protein
MTSTSFRLLGRTLVATCAVISALAGCGDGPVCQVESLVFISSPQGPIITDSDPRVDGIQQDVVVKSTFSGAAVTLTVTDADDAVVATLTGRTDDDGNFTFADVTIPTTGASLRVDADAGQCGNDSDEVAVALIGGGDCAIAFATPPVANPFYAPLDVWNAAADADPATAGFQGDTLITARPGEQVKLFLSAPGVPETEVAAGTVGDTGTVSLATSAPEGQVNLRAECGVADGVTSRSSGVTSIFVDTVAPACAMIEPIPGTSITPGLDANNDLSDGIQVTLRGAGDGGDGEGETASFTITEPGGMHHHRWSAPIATSTGQSTAAATLRSRDLARRRTAVRFATRDHADNAVRWTTQSVPRRAGRLHDHRQRADRARSPRTPTATAPTARRSTSWCQRARVRRVADDHLGLRHRPTPARWSTAPARGALRATGVRRRAVRGHRDVHAARDLELTASRPPPASNLRVRQPGAQRRDRRCRSRPASRAAGTVTPAQDRGRGRPPACRSACA